MVPENGPDSSDGEEKGSRLSDQDTVLETKGITNF